MNRHPLLAILLACFVALPQAAPPQAPRSAKQLPKQMAGRVSHVVDGDTLDVRVGSSTYRVRLEGIDAPERDQAFGQQALLQLRTMTFDRQVTVIVRDIDRYQRLVARLLVEGHDASEEMVRAGLAWQFVRYSSDARLAALEKEARQAGRGLWAERSPIPPWQFRASPAKPIVPAPKRNPSPAAGGGPYHGNVKSRVYHHIGCADYNCPNCTAVFASRQAAEAAGYRPHTACVR